MKMKMNLSPHPLKMAAVPDGAACYFCLGEEAEEEGMPLVRDCSCRGDSAGFAHFSCLTTYAEQKSKAAEDGDMKTFAKPWNECNNCKQPFQGQLTVDLASSFVSFAEATYGHPDNNKMDRMKVMVALRMNIVALLMSNDFSNEVANEKRRIIDNLLSMIDQTKKDFNMSRWIHMPKDSEEYRYYNLLLGDYEGFAYEELGGVSVREISKNGKMIATTHLKKARAIYNLVDMKENVQLMDTKISMVNNAVVKNCVDGESVHPTMCAYTSSLLQDMKKSTKVSSTSPT